MSPAGPLGTQGASASAHDADSARCAPRPESRSGYEVVTKWPPNAGVGPRSARMGPGATPPSRRGRPVWAVGADPRQNGSMSTDSTYAEHPDTFDARADLTVGDRTYEIFNITAPALSERYDIARPALLHQGPPGEPPASRGRAPRLGRRHRRRGELGRQPRGSRPGGRRQPLTRSPSRPSGCSCRTSPACPPSSTSPPCATRWLGWEATHRRSTRWSRSSSS